MTTLPAIILAAFIVCAFRFTISMWMRERRWRKSLESRLRKIDEAQRGDVFRAAYRMELVRPGRN